MKHSVSTMANILRKHPQQWNAELDKLSHKDEAEMTRVGSDLLNRLKSNCRLTRRKAEHDLWLLKLMVN